jgi:hypothetical protein
VSDSVTPTPADTPKAAPRKPLLTDEAIEAKADAVVMPTLIDEYAVRAALSTGARFARSFYEAKLAVLERREESLRLLCDRADAASELKKGGIVGTNDIRAILVTNATGKRHA